MKILLLGANGQLGRALQHLWAGSEVTAWDMAELDITHLEPVRKAINQLQPHMVVNAAAYTRVDDAETDIEAAFRVNARGPRNLALATAERGIPLLHVSTDYVFDGKATRPYHEFDRPNPLSVYGRSKLAGEEAVRVGNPNHFIVRTAWLYHTFGKNFALTICGLGRKGEVQVVNDQFGSPTYAPHLAQAINRLLETKAYGTYHMAGGGGTSWYEFTCQLFKMVGIQSTVTPVNTTQFPRPAQRPSYAVLTTLQDPRILLPPWEQGVQAFAKERQG
ncbi:MAG: dTDP-4-dehydrorhamnose reductase [Nitrospirales bacterium]|nr:dTDP-4-dehydrorhamnose reductase [Nitrospirales bacterium]